MEQTLSAVGQAGGLIDARPQSLTERMENERSKLKFRLDEIDSVLNQLKAHPETQALLDAVARLGHFGY